MTDLEYPQPRAREAANTAKIVPMGGYNQISRGFAFFDRFFRTAACVGAGNALRIHFAPMLLEKGRLFLGGHPFHFRGRADKGVLSHFYQKMFYIDDGPQPVTSIIDLGAHIGDETFKFAMRYPLAKIVAVEPSPANLQYLLQNVEGLASVTAVHAAVGPSEHKAWLVKKDGGTHESYFIAGAGDLQDASRIAEVDVVSIETLMKRHAFETVDIIKIDIEGMEDVIFFENNRWIDHVNAVVVETSNPRIVALMCERGFNVYHSGENFIFIRDGMSWHLQERAGFS